MPDQITDEWIQDALKKAREQGTLLGGQVAAPQEPQVVGPTTQSSAPKLTWEQRNAIPGIPIRQDLAPPIPQELAPQGQASGAIGLKTSILMRTRPEDKLSYLEGIYGKGNVRLADDQFTPLLLTPSPEDPKRMVEIPLIGPGFQLKDLPEHITANLPELVGALLGSGLGVGKGLTQVLTTAAGAAGGSFVGGVAKDVSISDAAFRDILAARGKAMSTDIPLNTVLGGVAKVTTARPFGMVASEEGKAAAEAARYLEDKFKVGPYPMTPGERLDSTFLRRVEAIMSKDPGSSAYFDRIKRQREAWLINVQNKMLSSKLDPKD